MGFIIGRETEEGYEPSLMFRLLRPKVSGNTINGRGETVDRLPKPVYHRMEKHPWRAVQLSFYASNFWDKVNGWSIGHSEGLKKAQSKELDEIGPQVELSAEEWTKVVKDRVLSAEYCDALAIIENDRQFYFDSDVQKETHFPKYIIVMLCRMDYEPYSSNLKEQKWWRKLPWNSKFTPTSQEVMRVYANGHSVADDLARWLRSQGHYAEGLGGALGSKINMLKAAVFAGLGELGKHGSLIHHEFGSAVRLAVVLTDVPLMPEGHGEFGADRFCESCQPCTNACPPNAITDTKQMVRGVEKWYVDFDRCVPYFNDARGCGICLAACPWSRPGVAPNLTKKMARKRKQDLAALKSRQAV